MIKEDMRKIHTKYMKLYNKADRYLNHQQYIQAIECYRKAIKIYPNCISTYCNMGISFDGLKQYEDAIKCYNKAISVNPDDHHAYHNKALSLAGLGYNELALEYYDKAMDLNPKRYEDMFDEVINESEAEMTLENSAEIEGHITKEIEQYINRGGVLS